MVPSAPCRVVVAPCSWVFVLFAVTNSERQSERVKVIAHPHGGFTMMPGSSSSSPGFLRATPLFGAEVGGIVAVVVVVEVVVIVVAVVLCFTRAQ